MQGLQCNEVGYSTDSSCFSTVSESKALGYLFVTVAEATVGETTATVVGLVIVPLVAMNMTMMMLGDEFDSRFVQFTSFLSRV